MKKKILFLDAVIMTNDKENQLILMAAYLHEMMIMITMCHLRLVLFNSNDDCLFNLSVELVSFRIFLNQTKKICQLRCLEQCKLNPCTQSLSFHKKLSIPIC